MPTALTVSSSAQYSAGITSGVLSIVGNVDDSMTVPLTGAPRLGLIVLNTTAGVLACTVNISAGPRSFNSAVTKSISVPAAVAGAPGVNFVLLDDNVALDAGSGSVSITGADVSGLYFAAVSWSPLRL